MRILFVSDVYFPRVNGVSTSIRTFTRALEQLGHEVHLIAPNYLAHQPRNPCITRIPARRVPLDPEDRLMSRRAAMQQAGLLHASAPFDIVHVHTPFVAHYTGVALARRWGVPCVETYHTFFEEYLFHYVPLVPKAWMRAAARRLSRAQCNDVGAVVVPSTAMRDVLLRYGIRTRMDIIPTGMELDRFRGGDGARFRQKHAISSDRPVMLHVGRVAFEKNIEFLLAVLERVRRRIPNVLFIIAGEGPARRSLELKVQHLGLRNNTRFIGYLDREHGLLDCYRAANCKVFASRTETQGLVLLEAMALGVPVVSTAIMGTIDVLQSGSGAIVVYEDADDFSDAVIRVLTDPSEHSSLSKAGQDYVRAWSSDELAVRLVDMYGDLLTQMGERRVSGSLA